jgi:YHS domain-containing protein
MSKQIFIFLGTFVAGALIALVARAALFKPRTAHEGHTVTAEYAPMVSNASTQTAANAPKAVATSAVHEHGATKPAEPGAVAHAHATTSAPAAPTDKPVNTVCAICGMDVDPSLPTAEYQGKKIGFGCRMCPPKFKANPDRYGPSYLRNEVMKR